MGLLLLVFLLLAVLIVDIICPIILLKGMRRKTTWTLKFATVYMGLFIIHCITGFSIVSAQFGVGPALFPIILEGIMLALVRANKNYFN